VRTSLDEAVHHNRQRHAEPEHAAAALHAAGAVVLSDMKVTAAPVKAVSRK
jgi:hypothetical protein